MPLLIVLAPHVKELMLFASPPVLSTATYMLVVCVEMVNVEVTPAGVFTWWMASEESAGGGEGGGGEGGGDGGGGDGGGGDGGGDGGGEGGGGGGGGGAGQAETVPRTPVRVVAQEQTVPPCTMTLLGPQGAVFPLMVDDEMVTAPS